MKIHLKSDIHLEQGNIYPSIATGDVCVLAGDISVIDTCPTRLRDYFKQQKDNFDHIIYVLGNHEFYHGEYQEVLDNAWEICEQEGIILLDYEYDKMEVKIDGVTFWGSALWMDFNNDSPSIHHEVGKALNDFYIIENFSTHRAHFINSETTKKINWDADVVITHHCPIVIPHPDYGLNPLTYGFCNSHLEENIKDSNIKYRINNRNLL